MSMNGMFVQVDEAELARLRDDPSLAEALFQEDTLLPPVFGKLANDMQARLRAVGGQERLAEKLAQLHPQLRQQIEASLKRVGPALEAGGGDALAKLVEQRMGRRGGAGVCARAVLSIDKAWHGVHYLLCGKTEPGKELLSQAVMGGENLGEDDEGFSGYGPARYFTAAQVAELSEVLSRPETETEAAGRFDVARMSEMNIYPGWEASDAEWVMGEFRRLRDFYREAARQGRAIVTCLV